MAKIAFYTLGCKVNQADTASMENLFLRSGHQLVSFDGEADVYIINTCVVTNTGQRKSRQTIHRAIRKNPNALIVVTGCYPQTAAEEVKAIAGVDMIIGNQDRAQIVQLVEERLAHRQTDTLDAVHKLTASTAFEEMAAGDITDKTRAFLKIQEGCNQFCTYCIIPFARGRVRSRKIADVLREVETLASKGYKEVVSGSGRYVSADGTRVFRMGTSDITGAHAGGSHVNFETLIPNPNKPGKMMVDKDLHIYLIE